MKICLVTIFAVIINLNIKNGNVQAQGKFEVLIVPTEHPFNWENPTTLTYGYLRSYIQKTFAKKVHGKHRSAMGHGFVRAQCSTGEEMVDFWSGYSNHEDFKSLHMLLGGSGLSIFYYKFNNGYIQSTEYINQYMKDIMEQPSIKAAFIRFNIDEEQCRVIRDHYETFRKNGTENLIYGLITDPLGFKSAGCTSYAVSFTQKAGILNEFLEQNWTREIKLTRDILGPTDQGHILDDQLLKPVSFFKLINPFRPLKWIKEEQKLLTIPMFDPQYMADFMNTSIECLKDPQKCKDKKDLMNWLIEHQAKLCSNEYVPGIEISLVKKEHTSSSQMNQ